MLTKNSNELTTFIKAKIAEITNLNIEDIDEDTEFGSLGLDSVRGLFILQELEEFLGEEINPLIFWNYPTIRSFSEYIIKKE